jgi:hypothetical protein
MELPLKLSLEPSLAQSLARSHHQRGCRDVQTHVLTFFAAVLPHDCFRVKDKTVKMGNR